MDELMDEWMNETMNKGTNNEQMNDCTSQKEWIAEHASIISIQTLPCMYMHT